MLSLIMKQYEYMYEALQKQVDIEDIIDIKAREKVGETSMSRKTTWEL